MEDYIQKARFICYGIDDELKDDPNSIYTTTIKSSYFSVPAPIAVTDAPIIENTRTGIEAVNFTEKKNTKLFRFSINRNFRNMNLTQNARIIIESITIPNLINEIYLQSKCVNNAVLRLKGISNHNLWDSTASGRGSSVIFSCPVLLNTQGFGRTLDTSGTANPDLITPSQKGRINCNNNGYLFTNTNPDRFYNFNVSDDFFKNGILEFELIYDIGDITKLTSALNGRVTSLTIRDGGSNYVEPVTLTITPTDGFGTGATAQVTNVTYSAGNVYFTNQGTGYSTSTTAVFSFPPEGGVQATGTPILGFPFNGTAGTGWNVVNGGTGYNTAPIITISPPPPVINATASATIAGGIITAITVRNQGLGYYAQPIITVAGGGGTGAVLTAVITNTRITSITITNGGTGFTSVPTIIITGGGGIQATATVGVTAGAGWNGTFNLTNAGSGYLTSSLPTITVTPTNGGTGMAFNVLALNTTGGGILKGITMTNSGSGYTTAVPPSVFLQNIGSGVNAVAVTSLTNGTIRGVNLLTQGQNYRTNPTVTITDTGNSGSGASITANVTFNEAHYMTVPQTLNHADDKKELESFMISMVVIDKDDSKETVYNEKKLLNKINRLINIDKTLK